MSGSVLPEATSTRAALSRTAGRRFATALVASLALVALIDLFTNAMDPMADGRHYVGIAEDGIFGNENLRAPFAYRPAGPLLAGLVSRASGLSAERAFALLARASAILVLLFSYAFARSLGASFGASLIALVAVGLSHFHIKYPLFFYSLVDVYAYPMMILATGALLHRRYGLCLATVCAGFLFKEFLAVPALLLLLVLARDYRQSRSSRELVRLAAFAGIAAASLVIPRLVIEPTSSVQLIDPFNRGDTIQRVIGISLEYERHLNVLFCALGYFLPTLLLITRERARRVWRTLADYRLVLSLQLGLVLLLSLYGGANIPIFVSYAVPVQIALLASLLGYPISRWEIAWMFVALILFNRTLLPIPVPQDNYYTFTSSFNAMLDFYAGWGSRINTTTLARLGELCAYLAIANGIRFGLGRRRPAAT